MSEEPKTLREAIAAKGRESGKDGPEGGAPTRARGPDAALVRLSRGLLARITDADEELILKIWREAAEATHRTYDLGTKEWIIEPDHKTRLAAGAIMAAYREGLPVARQITIDAKFLSHDEQMALALKSPETIRILLAGGAISEEQAAAARLALKPSQE